MFSRLPRLQITVLVIMNEPPIIALGTVIPLSQSILGEQQLVTGVVLCYLIGEVISNLIWMMTWIPLSQSILGEQQLVTGVVLCYLIGEVISNLIWMMTWIVILIWSLIP